MKLSLLYFAAVRELLGRGEETLEVAVASATVAELLVELVRRHPQLAGRLDQVRVAVNETFADTDAVLRDGDAVALIPPVAGG